MNPPLKLTAAIVLTFTALAVAFAIQTPSEALFVLPPLFVFGLLYYAFRRFQCSGLPGRWSQALWCAVLLASLASWFFYFGSMVYYPRWVVGVDDEPPEPQPLWHHPWLIHRHYLGLLRLTAAGSVQSITSAALIVSSILLPILAARAIIELRRASTHSTVA